MRATTSDSFGWLDQKGRSTVPGQDNGLADGPEDDVLRMLEGGGPKHV
ncbi:MAG: hypothetical protein NNA31_08105 [Nitrospira sp.]|nr:hypothetical protein [Nitrospira sp.]